MDDRVIAQGWLRQDGQKGIRNHVAVVFTVECAEHVARQIAAPYSDVQLLGYDGCHSNDFVKRVLKSLVINPNLFGVLVVSLGCETLRGEHIVEAAKKAGREAEFISIQRDGGTSASIGKGRAYVEKMLENRENSSRCDFYLSDLRIGTNCGGSDAMSGLASIRELSILILDLKNTHVT